MHLYFSDEFFSFSWLNSLPYVFIYEYIVDGQMNVFIRKICVAYFQTHICWFCC